MLGQPAIPQCDSPELRDRIRDGLLATYFQTYDADFLTTPDGQADIDAHVFGRYEACTNHVLPWVGPHMPLSGARAVEIGCGTGSSAAGFGWLVDRVDGYDIHEPSVDGARERMRVLGLTNVGLHVAPADSILDVVEKNHQRASVDLVLLYAVLEHQTIEERLRCIELSWGMLRDGGLLVVVESPNRLALWDHHTSLLPFFHMLPDALALKYYERSPRDAFRNSMRQAVANSDDGGLLALTRWGRGVGPEEFELVLGDVAPLMVASGYESPIAEWFPVQFEDELLMAFFREHKLDTPVAFTRHVLNFILRKGGRLEQDDDTKSSHGALRNDFSFRHPDRSLLDRLTELEAAYAALEATPAVRVARALDRYPRVRSIARIGWRSASRVRRALSSLPD